MNLDTLADVDALPVGALVTTPAYPDPIIRRRDGWRTYGGLHWVWNTGHLPAAVIRAAE